MRPLRSSLPAGLYELSIRITGQHLLLAPGEALNSVILGIIGRCQAGASGQGVRIHAFSVLSNHYHMLVSVDSAHCLSKFQCFVNGNIARRVNKLLGRSGALWERRFNAIRVVGDRSAQLWRLQYIMAHGVKEGLVARIEHWPGASSNNWLRLGQQLFGTWTDHSAETNAKRRKGYVEIPGQFDVEYPIVMSPLPCFQDTPADKWRRHIERIVDEIHGEADARLAAGDVVLGVAAILATDPFSRVLHSKHSRSPTVLAQEPELRREASQEHRARARAWWEAAAALAARLPPRVVEPSGKLPGYLWSRVTI